MTGRNNASVGRLATELNIPPDVIRLIISRRGMTPAMTINGVWHFDGEQISTIASELDRQSADVVARLAAGLR